MIRFICFYCFLVAFGAFGASHFILADTRGQPTRGSFVPLDDDTDASYSADDAADPQDDYSDSFHSMFDEKENPQAHASPTKSTSHPHERSRGSERGQRQAAHMPRQSHARSRSYTSTERETASSGSLEEKLRKCEQHVRHLEENMDKLERDAFYEVSALTDLTTKKLIRQRLPHVPFRTLKDGLPAIKRVYELMNEARSHHEATPDLIKMIDNGLLGRLKYIIARIEAQEKLETRQPHASSSREPTGQQRSSTQHSTTPRRSQRH